MNCLILLLFLLSSCYKPSPWAFRQIRSEETSFNSTKLTYASCDSVNEIDLEFLHHQDLVRAYLNVHSRPVPPSNEDPKGALVIIKAGTEEWRFMAYRLEGGQRLLLPQEATDLLVDLLKNLKKVTLSMSGYRTTIDPEDFPHKFDTLLHPFALKNPFQFFL